MLRWLTETLVRGPHAEFIRDDLEDIYLRERARGMTTLRALARHLRRVVSSAISVWRGDRPWLGRSEGTSSGGLRGGSMVQDFRFALRLCRKYPAPTSIAVGGLALAIAVVSSVFTIVDNTMLKPYGMDDPSSVVSVGSTRMHGFSDWRYSTFLRMREEASVSRVEAFLPNRLRFSRSAGLEGEQGRAALFVSGGYLQMLGARPEIGRPLEPSDDLPGAALVAVVSQVFWSTELNGDRAIVGKPLWLNGSAVTVVGVLRADFTGPVATRPAIWVPLSAFDDLLGAPPLDLSSSTTVEVIARLAPGAGRQAAEENLAAVANRAAGPRTQGDHGDARSLVQLFSAASPIDGRDATEAYLGLACIFGLVGLVLAVACANTANLLLAATTTRRQEMGIRLSLGASSRRLLRQMVNESLLLAVIAGGFGALLSIWLSPLLGAAFNLPADYSTAPDLRTLMFTIAIALICGLAAGLSPARYGSRGNVIEALKAQSGSHGSTSRSRLRTSFVGFQAAVSIFLLVAAALFARTAIVTAQTEVGFDADRLLTVGLGGSRTGFNESAYIQAATDSLRALPSVRQVSVTQHLPWGWSLHRVRFSLGATSYQLNVNQSDEAFFSTAGLRILRGRAFTRDEADQRAPVTLISESVARAFFNESDPIGQQLAQVPSGEFQDAPATIIGIVADAMLTPMDAQVYGSVYRPLRRLSADPTKPSSPPGFVVRTSTPARAVREIETALRQVDARVRPDVGLVSEAMEPYFGSKRTFALLSGPTAVVAVLLSVLGMFGVTAFAVAQRMQEVSIRLALGASGADVRRLLLQDSLRPVAVGLVVGLFAVLLVARFTASMFNLSGISPHDPIAVSVATSVLVIGALLAVAIPIRRVSSAAPASLLRQT
jgi:putative ABC transport system permease protein